MTFEEVYDLIKNLAKSQGSYGRLLKTIDKMDEDELDLFKSIIADNKFKDSLDFIMWLEG